MITVEIKIIGYAGDVVVVSEYDDDPQRLLFVGIPPHK